ncbi:helix-turn-helix domain-containing protein [Sinomicrobium soli]|uniref:helix-turn-helix domain-containing protein n=1 Tax=Sinomicrobium sp. N-1-3-6 TaxID=2219864 RepID=UPI000DCDB673|nr:helix-turn-helix domain-containing protein [Sinomicrobium sp. N-1-3-6]RAV27785.1 AraC family transcriptional regulator [Sinomicrobium sp. N-1-3-6]
MKKENIPIKASSISDLNRILGLPKPKHPLITVYRFENAPKYFGSMVIGMYCIAIKKGAGKFKYGQRYYDYDSGTMSFFSPNQVLSHEPGESKTIDGGIALNFHPDFLSGYPLAKTIKNYGFFSYELNEALHLSEQEKAVIENIMKNIEAEYQSNIDKFSQDVIIAQIELLLQYSNRFYNRQFITRKPGNEEILIRLENLLSDCFNDEQLSEKGLPSVQYIAEQLNVSSNYLSDMLRSITGQTTQQHIHNKLIEKAKELLSTTNLSITEIAYQLGFEHIQSFSKLFKNKVNQSPLEFRTGFN